RSITPHPLTHTLFPYTTLFRSAQRRRHPDSNAQADGQVYQIRNDDVHSFFSFLNMFKLEDTADRRPCQYKNERVQDPDGRVAPRSEEHTSELQSRGHLVCRLLL